jgi:very-short-patch-repair endonuclease
VHDSDALLRSPGDPAVAALAARQFGVVSVAQLRELGLARGAIAHRIRRGRLHPLHRGVYAVGHANVPYRGTLWSAVLACPGAVLSHRSAAALWDLLPPPAGPVHLTTARANESTARLRVHAACLHPEDVTRHAGLPLTTVARTLLDLADVLTPHRLERACHRAEHLRLLDARAVDAVLARSPGRRTRVLRRAVDTLAARDPDVTRSELEERFLALVARAGLPRPRVNARVAGLEVDFLWPERRLVVETDGMAVHATPAAVQRDRERDRVLLLARHRVARFTWHDLTRRPHDAVATLRALLR